MKYLLNSPFNVIFRLEELYAGGLTQSNARLLPQDITILRLPEDEQNQAALRALDALTAQYPPVGLYVIPETDRNLHLFRSFPYPNVRLALYVPTDVLMYDCMYFGRKFNFGAQIELLRRFFILNAAPVVIYAPDAIHDPVHFFEMAALFSKQFMPIQSSPKHEEWMEEFKHLLS